MKVQQALKGHVDLLVLGVLEGGPAHGYAVIEAIKERSRSEFELLEGTIYPVLHRLQRAGLLDSEWSEVSGRRRRTYRLTPAGRGALGEQRTAWSRFRAAVDQVIGGTPLPSTP